MASRKGKNKIDTESNVADRNAPTDMAGAETMDIGNDRRGQEIASGRDGELTIEGGRASSNVTGAGETSVDADDSIDMNRGTSMGNVDSQSLEDDRTSRNSFRSDDVDSDVGNRRDTSGGVADDLLESDEDFEAGSDIDGDRY